MHTAKDICSSVLLNDGVSMPLYGLGAGPGGPIPSDRPPGVNFSNTEEAILFAIQNGHRLIDTAQGYGNEEHVGRAVKASGIPREDIFIVTKVYIANMGYDQCVTSIKQSLKRLDVKYIDLMLIHSPSEGKVVETYQALLELKNQGVIRSVGVSNFNTYHLDALRAAGHPWPSVNQIELHPFFRQQDVVDYCRNKSITMMGYCPVAQMSFKDEPALVEIANRYQKTVAQVMVRWSLQQGFITIPKSCQPKRILENANVFDFSLNDEDFKMMDKLPNHQVSWNVINSPWTG